MNQLTFVYELMKIYLDNNSDQKTSPEYTLEVTKPIEDHFLVACDATLHAAMLVGLSVGLSVINLFFIELLHDFPWFPLIFRRFPLISFDFHRFHLISVDFHIFSCFRDA